MLRPTSLWVPLTTSRQALTTLRASMKSTAASMQLPRFCCASFHYSSIVEFLVCTHPVLFIPRNPI